LKFQVISSETSSCIAVQYIKTVEFDIFLKSSMHHIWLFTSHLTLTILFFITWCVVQAIFHRKNCSITAFFSLNDSMRLNQCDWNNEAKNKNVINKESEEEAFYHWWSEEIETDCYHCEYNDDWYAEYELLIENYCHCCWEIDWENEEDEEDLWRDIILFICLIIDSTKRIFICCSLNLINLLIKFFISSLSVCIFSLFCCINDHQEFWVITSCKLIQKR